MKSLLLSLLADPFGLSKSNLKFLLQIVEDEEGESIADEIEAQVSEIEVKRPGQSMTMTRYIIKDN